MRTSAKLAVTFSGLMMLGFFFACGSSDEEAGPSGGWTNNGGSAGAAGTTMDGGGAGGSKAGAAGASGGLINVDSSPNDSTSLPDACAATKIEASIKPANILFLIDRTGSMNCNPPPTQTTAECDVSPKAKDPAQDSKWKITRDAFIAALSDLKATTPTPSVGMALFNSDDYCGAPTQPNVDVSVLEDTQLNTFVLTLNAVIPKGDTPIVGTTMGAYQFMATHSYVGNKFVVILTDGKETCDVANKDFLVTKAEEATWVGIRTFVLGAPGSEGERAFLSRIAFAGGTASSATCDHTNADPTVGDCHIDMTKPNTVFKDELKAALEKVSGAALSCEIDVPADDGGKADPNKVNVKYESGTGATTTIPKDDAHPCDSTNQGWQYTDSTKTKIVVCGATCDAIKADPKGSLSVELGCDTVIPK